MKVSLVVSVALLVCSVTLLPTMAVSSHVRLQPRGSGQAVQVVRRHEATHDSDEYTLEMTEEGRHMLSQLTDKCHVLAVTGPYHSGKSFLQSQLMGKTEGFPVGTSVRPTTQGIWMWDKPVYTSKGSCVLLVDTEGLGAPGVPDSYDSLLFSLALSFASHIIYNTHGVIAGSEMNRLEGMARRAQLFRLKAYKAYGDRILTSDELRMPNMTWVAQSFGSRMDSEMTHNDWFNSLLQRQRQSNKGHGLNDVFPACFFKPVFIPTSSREKLEDLGRCDESDLTEEYRADIDALVAHLEQQFDAWKAHEDLRTGHDLAVELQMLLKAGKDGLMPEEFSSWRAFARNYLTQTVSHARDVLAKGVDYARSLSVPMNMTEFARHVAELDVEANAVLDSALMDQDAAKDAREHLVEKLKEEIERAKHDHADRVVAYLSKTYDKYRATLREHSDQWARQAAQQRAEFNSKAKKIVSVLKDDFRTAMSKFQDGAAKAEAFAEHAADILQKSIKANAEKVDKHFHEAIESAEKAYREAFTPKQMPIARSNLENALKDAKKQAQRAYDSSVEALGEAEDLIVKYSKKLVDRYQHLDSEVMKLNDEILKERCSNALHRAYTQAAQLNAPLLPMGPSNLSSHITQASHKLSDLLNGDAVIQQFRSEQPCKEALAERSKLLSQLEDKFKAENNAAFQEKVAGPLRNAAQALRTEASSMRNDTLSYHWRYFPLSERARQLALQHLPPLSDGVRRQALNEFLKADSPYTKDTLGPAYTSLCWIAVQGMLGAGILAALTAVLRSPRSEEKRAE